MVANLFERIFTPDIVSGLKEIQTKEDLVLALQRLIAVHGGGSGASGGSGLVALPVINMTFDPESINRLLVMARWLGKVTSANLTTSVLVPAGGTVTVTIPAEDGKVTLFFEDIEQTTDYVSNSITLDIVADGNSITPSPYEYVFARSIDSFSLGEFYYIERYLQGTFTNGSSTDATITWRAGVFAVESEFFHKKFYKPLVNLAIQQFEQLVGGALS